MSKIIRFEPNVAAQFKLLRTTSAQSLSKFDNQIQHQWRGRDAAGNDILFYASDALNAKIIEFCNRTPNALAVTLDVCKRVTGNKTQWIVQQAPSAIVETNQAHNTQSLPAAQTRPASIKPMPPAKSTPTPAAPAAAANAAPPAAAPSSNNVREVARLYAECWLEVQHAMIALGVKGLKNAEDLRHAASAVFIESTRRQIKPNVARLKELLLITTPASKAA